MTSPPPQRVSCLIPFVHVTDVERSIASYGHLGFVVTEIFTPAGRLNWANLVSGDAELMLQRAFGRVTDPAQSSSGCTRTTLQRCATSWSRSAPPPGKSSMGRRAHASRWSSLIPTAIPSWWRRSKTSSCDARGRRPAVASGSPRLPHGAERSVQEQGARPSVPYFFQTYSLVSVGVAQAVLRSA